MLYRASGFKVLLGIRDYGLQSFRADGFKVFGFKA